MQDSIFNLLTEEQLRGRNTLKWNYFGPDVVPLWLAEMDFPTAPAVLDGVRACVDNEEFGYPPLGEDSLPRATADWCRQRYGWCPRPDWVRVVPDVLKGMEVVVEFLTRPESPVALPVPAYMPFFDVLHVTGRQRAPGYVRTATVDNWSASRSGESTIENVRAPSITSKRARGMVAASR